MEKVDVVVIGAGVVGLSCAYTLSDSDREIIVIEKNSSFGQETSSRNSEVIHSGIYYPKESLKSVTCIDGKTLIYRFCEEYAVAYKKVGKVLVACDDEGVKKLISIYKNAKECNIDNIEFLNRIRCEILEPDITAKNALYVSDSGIIDTHAFMKTLFNLAKEKGVEFIFSCEVIGIERKKNFYSIVVKEPNNDLFRFESIAVINAAGLFSDRIAGIAGIDVDRYGYKLHYCKGQYYRFRMPKKFRISHLIYPPPTNMDLGIHITPDLAGSLRLGPDARYVDAIDYSFDDSLKTEFLFSVSKFLHGIEAGDLMADITGIRPKLQHQKENFRDFVIKEESDKGFSHFINLIGIESPGFTASLSIARMVKGMLSGV